MTIEKDTLLITGVNGFIGCHLAKACLNEGYKVIGIDMATTSIVSTIEYYQLNLSVESIDEILRRYKPYAVIHCAGMADVNYSVEHPESDFAANVIVSKNVLYSVKDHSPDSKFIFLSSAGIYGNPINLPIKEDAIREPISPYALHKMLVEDICWFFITKYNINIKILRIFSAYGNGLKKQLFWDMGQKVSRTGKLELFGTGNETRDFIHIADLTKVIMIMIEDTDCTSNVYNVANGQEIRIREVAEIFCRALNMDENIIQFNQRERVGNPSNWCADIEKIKKMGYQQKVSIEEGIKEYTDWLRSENYI